MSLDILQALTAYRPWNEQEERDRSIMLSALSATPDPFTRDNEVMHFTGSSWIVNRDGTKVLMAYHNLYASWAWLGGHADGDEDLLEVACREVREESGIGKVVPVTGEIFSVEVLTVDGHEKRGVYVPSHLHLNVTYLLEADSREDVRVKEDENSAVGWFPPQEAVERSCEPWFRERIYTKLNRKLFGQ